ncbi:MAG: hypothetical protein IKW04_04045 [Clostridia bacterium]|nr:hypothetical protein [Clostridia bacterium]
MKKFLSLLLALTLVVGMLSAFTVSAAVNTTVFYNALTNEPITSLDGVNSIYATTTFTGRYEDNAVVIASHYDENGKLLGVEFINPVESTIGASVAYTTPVISVADTDILKIFAWTGVDTLKPLLKFPGVISRSIDLPTATVTELDVATITDVPLTFAMNFKADPVTEAQLLAYGNWYADFELKVNKDVTFNLDGTADGYLAGQYDSWSPAWVTVPKMDVTLAANTPLKIMETASELYGKPGVGAPGLKYTCQEVFDRVKDFDCGVFFSEEFLAANPDIYVTLELRIYNPLNESESYLINSETYEFGKIPGTPEPVDYTNAPYAGVYQVTSDKAVTLTNETGHTATLAAGETGYFYLIKGNNDVTGIGDANVTFTALEGNGMDYLAEVAITKVPLTANRYYIGRPDDGQNIGSYVVSKDDNVVNNTSNVTIPAGASVVINVPVPADNAGIYSFGIYTTQKTSAIFRLETDTGYYGDLMLDGGNFTEISADSIATGSQIDLEQAYLREGDNHVTITNNGYSDVSLSYVRIYKTAQLESLADYNWALNYNYFKVVIADGEEPEVTPTPVPTETPAPTPEPTPEATPDVPAVESVDYTNAPYAGVYMVTSDKAVTLTNETGHTATLAAGVPGYFYLIKGNNNIAGIDGATLTITAIAGNGMDYYSQVNAGSVAISTATTYFGPAGEGSHIGEYYVASENGTCTVGTDYVIIPAGATAIVRGNLKGSAGIYYVTLFLEKISGGTITVESDTGYYGEYLPTAINWTTFGTESASDLEVFYLRDGANTIKVTNNGSDYITLTGVKLARTNNVGAYADQLNIASCKVVPYVAEANKVTTEATVLTSKNVTAEVPAGVLLSGNELSLTTTVLDESESGVEAGVDETLSAFDVHVAGVSKENTTPIIVTINEAAPAGLNKGNLSLYHVDNGETVPMVEVENKEDLVEANQFTYDPADGTVILAMTSFSEIAMLSDNTKVWNGNATYDWYDINPNADTFYIANADQMVGFGKLVGGMRSGAYVEADRVDFAGKTVVLLSDLNFGGAAVAEPNGNVGLVYYPVGYYNEKDGDSVTYSNFKSFKGDFDGNGNTIANIYQTTWIMEGDYHDGYPAGTNYYKDGMGVFGYVVDGTVKNLTVKNLSTVGEFTPTGCVAAYAGGNATFENITLENCNPQVYNTGNGGIVGINGSSSEVCNLTFRNITIDQTNKISALWGSWDVGCGGIMGMLRGNADNKVHFENCHVAAIIDVNNDVCANYQYYQYRYAGMYLGTVDYHINFNGQTRPDIQNRITAVDCSATYGDWNEYWYCELVANSLASYTHDHQFSRLTKIASVSDIQNADGSWKTTGNFIIPPADKASEGGECFHIMKKADGTLYRHFHDVADESNPNIYETKDINGDGELNDLKEDRQRYYMPFGQLFTGYGWGARAIYNETDLKDYTGIEIDIKDSGTVTSIEKFASKGVTEIEIGSTVKLGDLFDATVTDQNIVQYTLQAFVSPVGEESTVTATVSMNNANWRESTITFAGEGDAKITLNDYFYCVPTTIYVTVAEAKPVDKFVGKEVTLTHDLTTIESGIATTLGELFDTVPGAEINSASVTVDVTGNATVTLDKADWTKSTVVLNGTDAITLKITDNNLCNEESITVSVTAPAAREKWTATNTTIGLNANTAGKDQTVAFDTLFKANGEIIKNNQIEVTVSGNGSYSNGTITVPGVAGTYTVTVTDKFYCTASEATITVTGATKVDKFTSNGNVTYKLIYPATTKDYTLGDLFSRNSNWNLGSKVYYTVDGNSYNVASGSWSSAKVTLGVGEHTITINDGTTYCNTKSVKVTIQDSDAVTKFTGKTANVQHTISSYNAGEKQVRLGDIFTGNSYVVTGNITVKAGNKTTTVQAAKWEDAMITVPGKVEKVTVTITDNNKCNTATGYVNFTAPAEAAKWTGNSKTKTWTLANYGTTQTFTFDEMFTRVGSEPVGTVTLTLTSNPNSGASISGTSVNVTKAGTYKVTAKDNLYSTTVEATIIVKDPTPVNKWTVKANPSYEIKAGATQSVSLGTLFKANGNTIGGTVTYKVDGVTAGTATKDNWSSKNVALGIGTHKVSIIDSHFSASEVEATVTITEMQPVQKFEAVDKYIYREHPYGDLGGTQSFTMTLGEIFKATGTGTINSATVEVKASATAYAESVASHNSTTPLTVSIQPNTSDWTKSVVTLNGNGEATFTITDNDYCLTAKAVVGVSPYWAGNVDSGGVDTEGNNVNNGGYYQSNHYSSKKHRTSADLKIGAGDTKEIVFNSSAGVISYDGVYGLCFDLSGAANLRVQTASGYYADIITQSGDWTDDQGADAPLYIKKGEKVTVTNRGSAEITIVSGSMATELQNGNYDDMDFFPLVKANTYAINPNSTLIPNPGDAADPETPTPTPTPTPGGQVEGTVTAPTSYQWNFSSKSSWVNFVTNGTFDGEAIYFQAGKNNVVEVTIGVAETGDYNVNAMLACTSPGSLIYDDVTLTTEDGQTFTYGRKLVNNGGGYVTAPQTVHLVKGNRTLTFKANCTSGNGVFLRGIKLVK